MQNSLQGHTLIQTLFDHFQMIMIVTIRDWSPKLETELDTIIGIVQKV